MFVGVVYYCFVGFHYCVLMFVLICLDLCFMCGCFVLKKFYRTYMIYE